MKKTETISDFLARGGKITKVSYNHPDSIKDSIKSTSGGGPVTILTMDDADLFYGEHKVKKQTKKKVQSIIDISALPEALRKKYVDEVIYGSSEEESAEEDSEDSDEE